MLCNSGHISCKPSNPLCWQVLTVSLRNKRKFFTPLCLLYDNEEEENEKPVSQRIFVGKCWSAVNIFDTKNLTTWRKKALCIGGIDHEHSLVPVHLFNCLLMHLCDQHDRNSIYSGRHNQDNPLKFTKHHNGSE